MKILVWLSCIFFYLFQFILRSFFGVCTESLMRDLNIGVTEISFISYGYYFPYCIMQIPSGLLLDKYGYKKIMPISFVFCLIGGVMFSFVTSVKLAFLARFVMGIGGSCAFIGCALVTKKIFNPRYIKVLLGVIPAVGKAGGALASYFYKQTQQILSLVPYANDVISYLSVISLVHFTDESWNSILLFITAMGFVIFIFMIIAMATIDCPDSKVKGNINLLDGLQSILKDKKFWLISIYASVTYIPLSAFIENWAVIFLIKSYGIESDKVASSIVSYVYKGAFIGTPLVSIFLLKATRKTTFLITTLLNIFCFSHLVLNLDLLKLKDIFFLIGIAYGSHPFVFLYSTDLFPKSIGTSNGAINMVNVSGTIITQFILERFFTFYTSTNVKLDLCYKLTVSIIPLILFISLMMIFFFPGKFLKKDNKSDDVIIN